MDDGADPDQSRVLWPVLTLGAVALLVLGLQPLLYGAYLRAGLISEQRLGTLAAAEVSAIALGSMIGVALLRSKTAQTVGMIGIAILFAANLLPEAVPIFLTRVIAGLGSGLIVGLAAVRIAQQINVNAASGLFLFLQATSQYAIMQAVSIVAPTASAGLMQMMLSVLTLLAAPLLLVLPRHLAITEDEAQGGIPPRAGWVALGACSLFVGAAIGIWAYLGVWLESAGISPDAVSPLVTASLAGQMAGALGAVALGTHGRSGLQVVVCGLLMIAAVVLLLLAGPGGWAGWVLLIGFGFAWMIGTPALSGLVLQSDPLRSSLPYAASAQLLGAALFPTLVGELLAPEGIWLVLATCAALTAGAIILVPLALATASSFKRTGLARPQDPI